ncbi:MAG: UvrD-helicase domain-containing protein [Clostridiaceae bacterium]
MLITENRKTRPDIVEDLSKLIDSYFSEIVNYKDMKQIYQLITYFSCYLNIPKDLEEFENLGEYHDFYRNIDFETIKGKFGRKEKMKNEFVELSAIDPKELETIDNKNNDSNSRRNMDFEIKEIISNEADGLKAEKQTLQGERVKSLEELMIANFLFLNGINYIYEFAYPHDTGDKYKKHYRPDFYLPDYDIYIEHFGITKDCKVPWLSKIEEKKYLEGIGWKRSVHKRNCTRLLETYSFYNKDGELLEKLEEKLKKAGIKFRKIDYLDIYKKVFYNKNDNYFGEFKKLIASFIGLYKSNGYGEAHFTKLKMDIMQMKNVFLKQRSNLFIDIVRPIFIKYQEYLESNGFIDFNDMINIATSIVKQGDVKFKYKYIIIDEYQDISKGRFNLIKEIKNETKAKVMCVGDDWQSIYRFAGSDISLFTDFRKYFGYYELLKIESTYRNSQELINIAGSFIMKNPKQLKKNLKSVKRKREPIRMVSYDTEIAKALEKSIEEIVSAFGDDTEITILGRNNFDIEIIEKDKSTLNKNFKLIKQNGQVLVKYRKYPELKMTFLTVHRSKGLEADNVIVINLENKTTGFPNRIADDPILKLVLADKEEYDFAEERRLFYVALTRTRNTTYLLTPTQRQSAFSEEISRYFHIDPMPAERVSALNESLSCPRCQKGHLVIRSRKSDDKKFIGCSNNPFCDMTFNNVEIINDAIICSSCGGYMVKRTGMYGEFYGCTNYPICNNTLGLDKKSKRKYANSR